MLFTLAMFLFLGNVIWFIYAHLLNVYVKMYSFASKLSLNTTVIGRNM